MWRNTIQIPMTNWEIWHCLLMIKTLKIILTLLINDQESKDMDFNWSQRLDLTWSNIAHIALNLSIYCTWKNIGQQYNSKKLKIIGPMWKDEFELSNGFYSVPAISDFIEYIIKNLEI